MPEVENPLLPPHRVLRWPRFGKARLVLLGTVLLLITMVGLVSGAVYFPQHTQFVPQTVYELLNRWLLATTLPKTTYQIVLAAIEKSGQIDQFDQRLFITLDAADNRLNLRLDGPVNLDPPALEQKISVLAETQSYGDQVFQGELRLNTQGSAFRFNFLPRGLLEVLEGSLFVGRWYTVTWSELGWKPAVWKFSAIDLDGLRLERESVEAFKNLGREELDGQVVYHLRLEPSLVDLDIWVRQILVSQGFSTTEASRISVLIRRHVASVEADVWINAQTYYPLRLVLTLDGTLPELPRQVALLNRELELPALVNQPVQLHLGWEITGVNRPQSTKSLPSGTPVRELISP